jgi:aminoglycoside phosphotransferase (APT) family kinase protein
VIGERFVAKHYRPGFDDYSLLSPLGTAAKVVAAARHLPERGVPIPPVIEVVEAGDDALVASERIVPEPFGGSHRIAAARILRRLHDIAPASLPPDLREPVMRSRRNRGRIRIGVEQAADALAARDPTWGDDPLANRVARMIEAGEPPSADRLIHGDYFSANLLASGDRVFVVDWDLLSVGDPMWDLAFLVGADRDLDGGLIDRVLDAYGREAIDEASLAWHVECWALFWVLRDASGAPPSP